MTIDRLEFASKALAQAQADKIHAAQIARDPEYARSVAAGQTTAWAIPYQDEVSGAWCVNVKDRGRPALNGSDRAALKPFAVVAQQDLGK